MQLLLTADQRFLPGLELTLVSSLAHAGPDEQWVAHVLDAGIEPASWNALRERLATLTSLQQLTLHQPNHSTWRETKWTTQDLRQPYLWLATIGSLGESGRVLCLDTDLLITRPLLEVFQHKLDRHPLAAAQDVTKHIRGDCPDPDLIRSFGDRPYANTGVLLVDLEQWHRQDVFTRCDQFIARWKEQCHFWDQTALNAVLTGGFSPLNQSWNLFHEAMGHLETPSDQRLPREGYVWHLWRQYKPWLAFNPLESGALWYGLHEAWHGPQSPRYHTTRPGYRTTTTKMRLPRLAQFTHRLRGHREMADYWSERARSGTGRGHWAQRFAARVDDAAELWRSRLHQVAVIK